MTVFIRMVFSDFSTKEELFTIIPLKGKTRGEDLFNSFKYFINTVQLPLYKLVSITTDGVPAMTGCCSGFIALCRKDGNFPDFLQYHCIIHQQALCAKILNMKDIMDIAFKICNSIRAKSLQRRLFKLQVEDSDRLSRGKFLQRFRDLIDEIKQFLADRGDDYQQLKDDVWLLDLAFLTDITGKLNELNLELQGPDKTILNMISTVNMFQEKLHVLVSKLEKKDLSNFTNMMDHINNSGLIELNVNRYSEEINNIIVEFQNRFQDFKKLDSVVLFCSYPFDANINADIISKSLSAIFNVDVLELEAEIITLKNDINIKARASEHNFWKYLPEDKYPNVRKCLENLYACFGSTYLCESAFSQMNVIKSKYRSTLTDEHLESCLRNGVSNYTPNYARIVDALQCRVSNANSAASGSSH